MVITWQIIKAMGRARSLINDINTTRMNALRNPDGYTQGFDKYDNPKECIAFTLHMGLTKLGHNVDDYIPGNIEATVAFKGAVDEIYELVCKS